MHGVTRNRLLTLLTALGVLVTTLSGPAYASSSAWALPAAAVVTQAPPAVRTAVFTIGSTTYTVDGRVYQMDAAPIIVSGHTLMPVRYLANSLGIPDSGISYQPQWSSKPTLAAVDLYRQRADGSQLDVTLYFNPADPSQDGFAPQGPEGVIGVKFVVAPQVVPPGRLMIPYRDVAQALGAIVAWNGSTRQVTVKTWQTLPAVPGELTADQVAMQPGSKTITAINGGTPAGQQDYPYPVEITNPYYPGTGQTPHLYALIPTLEAFGVPAQNILWDPASQSMVIAGNSPFQFIYLTVGSNINDNLTDEFAVDLDPQDLGPSVSMVDNGVLYADNTVDLILVFGFHLQLTDQQGNNIDPIIEQDGVLAV
ncbi:MAG TPA: stalk domain-containing protein [Spirochaetia bacterium]|nr:stalk domain-containing protein [Spirochaetia bacterium]